MHRRFTGVVVIVTQSKKELTEALRTAMRIRARRPQPPRPTRPAKLRIVPPRDRVA